MAANNCWNGVGHLGKDPDVKMSPKGVTITTLSLAVNGIPRDGKEVSYWFTVKVLGKSGEAAGNILQKGSLVAVSGEIQTYTFDKTDGTKGYGWEVKANDWRILSGGKKKDQAQGEDENDYEDNTDAGSGSSNDDFPF